jgi:hypothetical protein
MVIVAAHKGNKYAAEINCKYKPEYNDMAFNHCLLGADDKELANLFNVTETTINNWKIEYPKFFESIKDGKLNADAHMAKSLYHRGLGYTHDDEEIKVVPQGQGLGSEIVRVPIKKHYPPDPTSCIFWLKNRQGKYWREKIDIESKTTLEPFIIRRASTGEEICHIEYKKTEEAKK